MSAEVYLNGAKKVIADLEKRQAMIERNRERAARSAATIVRRAIRAEARKIRGTGTVVGYTKRGRAKVRHKLETSVQIWRVPLGWAVGPKTPIAHLVIRGHAAPSSPIVPHGAGARALSWSAGGQTVFAASSPGGRAAGNPFVHRALDELTRTEAVEAAKTTLFGGPDAQET